MPSSLIPTVALRHGAAMPRLALGTWPLTDEQVEPAVASAIGAGYRHIDTAENYGNERGVGKALRGCGVPRDELFVTTKFNKEWHGVAAAGQAYERSIERLGLDYLDLLLIHWPNPQLGRYVEAWRGLVALLEGGHVRAIGVSNFKPAHLARLIDETGVVPDLNQIQLSPFCTRDEARGYHREHGIVTESWSPLGGEGANVLRAPAVVEVARRYGRPPAHVALRWQLELGLAVVVKSADPVRIRENMNVFDFTLDPADVAAISSLDQGESAAADSDVFGH
jgi:2,5-diketo-D-gluconate reductase A